MASAETDTLLRKVVLEYMDSLGRRQYYDDDATRYVQERLGSDITSREVYQVKNAIRDEEAAATEQQLLADGFVPWSDADVRDGARYWIVFGTMYCGYNVPRYGPAREMRARMLPGPCGDRRWVLLKPRARTNGQLPTSYTLVKDCSAGEP